VSESESISEAPSESLSTSELTSMSASESLEEAIESEIHRAENEADDLLDTSGVLPNTGSMFNGFSNIGALLTALGLGGLFTKKKKDEK
ncbi:LPXTG cell wall anchor domain-containing protein, partial [Aerococcus urinaeequi]